MEYTKERLPSIEEMLCSRSYPLMPEGQRLPSRMTLPVASISYPGYFCLFSEGTSTYFGKGWKSYAEAVEAANRDNARMAEGR